MKVHYKNCTPEDLRLLEQFEPEIQKAVATVREITSDVCWEPSVVKTEVKEYRFYHLSVMNEQENSQWPGFGKAFMERVSGEEFYDWLTSSWPQIGIAILSFFSC